VRKILLILSLPFFSLPAGAQNTRLNLRTYNNSTFTTNGFGIITGKNLNAWNNALLSSVGLLGDSNTWAGINTFLNPPTIPGCSGFLYGNGASPITCVAAGGTDIDAPAGPSGSIQFNNAGTPGGFTVSGDGALVTSTGILTVTKTSGVAFSSLATTVPGTNVVTALGNTAGSAGGFALFSSLGSLASLSTINNSNWSGAGLTLANQATLGANTVEGNATASAATPTALTMPSCSSATNALLWTTSGGFSCNSSITATALPASALTGTTIASGVTGSSLTGVGTLTSGAWTASVIGMAYGGTNAALTASNGGIVYSSGSALALLSGTGTASQCLLSGSNAAPVWGSCAGGATVSSVSNSDGTVTISPTTGAVVASLALGHANTWTGAQTFTNSDIILLGSSTGATTFTSANASATGYTLTFPAANDTVALLAVGQVLTNKTISGASNTLSNIALSSMATEAANTVIGNGTAGVATPTALAVGSCSTTASALIWTSGTGFGCNTSVTASSVAVSGVTGLGTGVGAALAVAVGTAGSPVLNGGALGTPTTGTLTNTSGYTTPNLTTVVSGSAPVAGKLGEVIQATVLLGSAITPANITPGNVASVSLTAGHWACSGAIWETVGTGSVGTAISGWVSTSSATAPTVPNSGEIYSVLPSVGTGGYASTALGNVFFDFSVTTTVYLEGQYTNSTQSSPNNMFGTIQCERHA
jgi:hypothetical protein